MPAAPEPVQSLETEGLSRSSPHEPNLNEGFGGRSERLDKYPAITPPMGAAEIRDTTMFKTTFAAAALAAIAAAASTSSFAQDREALGNITALTDSLANQRLRPALIAVDPGVGQSVADTATGDVQTGRQNLVIDPGQGQAANGGDAPIFTPRIAVPPGQGQSTSDQIADAGPDLTQPGSVQQVVIDPGQGQSSSDREERLPNRQIVVEPAQPQTPAGIGGIAQLEPPATEEETLPPLFQIDPPAAAQPQAPAATEVPPAAAQAPATTEAPAVAAGQPLELWQVQFRLGKEGFYNVRFIKSDAKYFYLLADLGDRYTNTYVLAIDAYAGTVVAAKEYAGNYGRYAGRYEQHVEPTYRYEDRYSDYRTGGYDPDCPEERTYSFGYRY